MRPAARSRNWAFIPAIRMARCAGYIAGNRPALSDQAATALPARYVDSWKYLIYEDVDMLTLSLYCQIWSNLRAGMLMLRPDE